MTYWILGHNLNIEIAIILYILSSVVKSQQLLGVRTFHVDPAIKCFDICISFGFASLEKSRMRFLALAQKSRLWLINSNPWSTQIIFFDCPIWRRLSSEIEPRSHPDSRIVDHEWSCLSHPKLSHYEGANWEIWDGPEAIFGWRIPEDIAAGGIGSGGWCGRCQGAPVSPAHAGMDPADNGHQGHNQRVPRTRGDGFLQCQDAVFRRV